MKNPTFSDLKLSKTFQIQLNENEHKIFKSSFQEAESCSCTTKSDL